MARHFAAPPPVVDGMELWQVVACLLPERRPDDLDVPTPGRPTMRSIDVIKARLAAHERGEPEPLHLFGVPT